MFKRNTGIGCLELAEVFPLELTCPRCGSEIDLWNDEGETMCRLCGFLVFEHERVIN